MNRPSLVDCRLSGVRGARDDLRGLPCRGAAAAALVLVLGLLGSVGCESSRSMPGEVTEANGGGAGGTTSSGGTGGNAGGSAPAPDAGHGTGGDPAGAGSSGSDASAGESGASGTAGSGGRSARAGSEAEAGAGGDAAPAADGGAGEGVEAGSGASGGSGEAGASGGAGSGEAGASSGNAGASSGEAGASGGAPGAGAGGDRPGEGGAPAAGSGGSGGAGGAATGGSGGSGRPRFCRQPETCVPVDTLIFRLSPCCLEGDECAYELTRPADLAEGCQPASAIFLKEPGQPEARIVTEGAPDQLITPVCEGRTLLAFSLPGCCMPNNQCGVSTYATADTLANLVFFPEPFTSVECVSVEELNEQFQDSPLAGFGQLPPSDGTTCDYADLDARL